ncbi:hypothetical protein KY495_15380 [Massilia sp. PAMC28688]|uniref:SRPBCC family protein n=1 Tax=Massilia sp. PAMC28688 TaxID=2861283 RepID=UPI001C6251EC|nr:SRPBCC family protein [Massilia sp. PAMC28688]QYF92141.1 hypothetical protein KY495_15380 [Massilia sp. PAMC28688]
MSLARAFLLSCLLPASAFAADAIDLKSLGEKEVRVVDVSKTGSPGKSFVAATIVNAPLQEVCKVLQQYESYPAFMPNTHSAKVSHSAATHALVDVTLKLPMGKIKKYRLRMEPAVSSTSCVLAWKQVPWPGLKQEETIADTTGQWHLTPHGAGRTAVRYSVYTDPGPIPFGLGWIVDSLSKDSIPQTLEGVRRRVVKL